MGTIQNIKEYKGYSLLTNHIHIGFNETILDALLERAKASQEMFRIPLSIIVSFSFTENYSLKVIEENRNIVKPRTEIAKLTDRLKKRFNRLGVGRTSLRSLFDPQIVWVKEEKLINKQNSEFKALNSQEKALGEYWYTHYHMQIFIDGQYATSQSIHKIFKEMEKEGKLREDGWRLSREHGKTGVAALTKDLNERFDDWFKHASYLAKLETKDDIRGRSWGASRLPRKSKQVKAIEAN